MAVKIERTKNATRNVFWGLLNKILIILAQLIIRLILIKTLGEAYLGLNSLFTAVLSVLSLAEVGIGSALVFHMYAAIADGDEVKICALLQFYKKCYHTIALVILAVGVAVMPFLPYLIHADLPKGLNLYVLYALNLSSTVISYSFYAYKGSLLEAHQRSDILSKLAVFLNTLQYGVQILLLLLFKNYYLYSLVTPIIFLATNFFTSFAVDRQYPQYRAAGKIDQGLKGAIFNKVKALFVYKVGGVVATSVDSIVVSACLGLVILAKYSNYHYVITMLFSFLIMYNNAITAGLGNSVVTETPQKNFHTFEKLVFMQAWICGFCAIALACLLQDFISLWMGADMLISTGVAICFAVYFYVWKAQDTVNVFKDAAGLWEADRFRPIVFSVVNLALNLIFVQFIDVYGILLSTILCSLFIDLPWSSRVLFKNYFHLGRVGYYKQLLLYTVVNIAVGAITYAVCLFLPASEVLWQRILFFALKVLVCALLPNLLYVLFYHRTQAFQELFQTLKSTFKNFLKK